MLLVNPTQQLSVEEISFHEQKQHHIAKDIYQTLAPTSVGLAADHPSSPPAF
jgi:hypothetical protein